MNVVATPPDPGPNLAELARVHWDGIPWTADRGGHVLAHERGPHGRAEAYVLFWPSETAPARWRASMTLRHGDVTVHLVETWMHDPEAALATVRAAWDAREVRWRRAVGLAAAVVEA